MAFFRVEPDSDCELIREGNLEPLGYQQITVLTAAIGLTVPAGATIALLQAEGDDIRWRDDGTVPTAAIGMLIQQGRELAYTGRLEAIKFIEVTASGILNVSFYG